MPIGDSSDKITSNAIRDIVRARIQSARKALDKYQPIHDDDVHAARKHLKAARAGLRLLRKTVGRRCYAQVDTRLRDAARPLSAARDAQVLLETTRKLIKIEKDRDNHEILSRLAGVLRKERIRARSASLASTHTVESILSKLSESERIVTGWEVAKVNGRFDSAIKQLYRKSRKAMHLAQENRTDDTLHEARKQAKYLSLALKVVRAAGHTFPRMFYRRVTAIGEHLGADRDLALLQSKVTTVLVSELPIRRELLLRIDALRKKLQVKVFHIGKQVYSEKASAMNLRRVTS
jgi:hypothetical protein